MKETSRKKPGRVIRNTAAALLAAAAVFLCGCRGDGDNSKKYGSPVDFEGSPHSVEVMFVNVGKADCAVVSVDGNCWLVDCGTEESAPRMLGALEIMGISGISGVLVTHGHSDHAGGLGALAEKYGSFAVVTSAYLNDASLIDDAAEEYGLSVTAAKAGDYIAIADGVGFEVLSPVAFSPDDNDNSLVVMLRVNGRRFLFTGDIEQDGDKTLVSSGADIACDVLKVPNHGNPDAVSEAFAKAASPLISVISTDTSVDTDSANRIVKAKLAMSDIFLTEETDVGLAVSVSPRGEIAISRPERPSPEANGVSITEASKQRQTFTLKNGGADTVDISGWCVLSSKGGEIFVFPKGTSIGPGAQLTVACRKSPDADTADIVWNVKKAWADSKTDFAVLYDAYGNELCRTESK